MRGADPVFDLLAEKSVSGAMCGSPSDTARMLDFAARSGVKPVVEHFAMADINQALDHVRAGKARYRVVLSAQRSDPRPSRGGTGDVQQRLRSIPRMWSGARHHDRFSVESGWGSEPIFEGANGLNPDAS